MTTFLVLTVLCVTASSHGYSAIKKRENEIRGNIKSPVVIVPGTGGSQIEAKLNKPSTLHWYCHKTSSSFFTLWLQKSSLLPWAMDCWVDNMRLVYDKSTNTVHNAPGVQTRVPGFGQTNTIEYLDTNNIIKYFYPLVSKLVSWGYTRGTTVKAAPYDFRYAPDSMGEYYKQLRDLIEETYANNGNTKVTLLSHSLGCPYTLVFLNQQTTEWKNKHIKHWVALSGVWGGTVQLVKLFASGDSFGVPIVNPLAVRQEQRTCTSNNFMLPNRELWKPDEVLVTTAQRTYTVKDYDQFFQDIGFPDGIPMRRKLENLTTPLWAHPPNVTLYCLHGSHVDTEESYTYGAGEFPDSAPQEIKNGDGDGTVNLRSLSACATWGKRQVYAVTVKDYPGVNHNGMLGDENVLNYLKEILFQ